MTAPAIIPESSVFLEWFSTAGTAFVLIFLAELGDKTQLVCMTLAARYRGWPVFLGSLAAFILLNILAVIFGAALAQWLPENVMIIIVAIMFAVFGIQSLRASDEDEDDADVATTKSGRSIVMTAFLMIFVAELGDKTQIAVAGLAGAMPPIPVWVGSTLALGLSSALAVIVGSKLLQKIPMRIVHRLSGIFFLALAGLALTRLA